MTGKVWLVGAGPGDRGLLTLKGQEVLREAEVVVYDALVGDEVLTLIPENAKKINAGKRAGCHLMAPAGGSSKGIQGRPAQGWRSLCIRTRRGGTGAAFSGRDPL